MTHRDPVKVLASCASFTEVLRGPFTDCLDRNELGDEVTRRWEKGAKLGIQFRRGNADLEGRFLDVWYADLVREPMAVIRQIYDHFEMVLTDDAERAMRRFLAENPQNKSGVHRYSLETYGLDRETRAAPLSVLHGLLRDRARMMRKTGPCFPSELRRDSFAERAVGLSIWPLPRSFFWMLSEIGWANIGRQFLLIGYSWPLLLAPFGSGELSRGRFVELSAADQRKPSVAGPSVFSPARRGFPQPAYPDRLDGGRSLQGHPFAG